MSGEYLTPEEALHRTWLVRYERTRPTLPRGVPGKQVDGAPGDEYAPMPGFTRIVAVRRAGEWVGWVMTRHVPGAGQCAAEERGVPGCSDRNCPSCPDTVSDARRNGFTFLEAPWPSGP